MFSTMWIVFVAFLSPTCIAESPTSARELVARQATSSIDESTIIFSIQTDTVLDSTTSPVAPFSNTTFTISSTPSSTAASTTSGTSGINAVTSIALSTFTIPQDGGGVVTSTAFAAPSTSGRAPTVLGSAGNHVTANLKEAGLLGAIVVAAISLL